jgi:hypothetical protein
VTAHLHRIDLAEPGTFDGARAVCLGTDDDRCRQWCAEGCEEACSGRRIIPPPAPELIAQAPVEGHRWEPIGSCRVAEWIDAAGLEDTCADDDALAWDKAMETQPGIRSGFIEEEWTGDDYVWSYADQATGEPS